MAEALFKNLIQPKDLSKYTLMRGATDFANVGMWNAFESGYSYLTVVQIPRFLELLAAQDSTYKALIDNYVHILEYEFKGLDGIDNITSENGEISNGINTLSFINKVTMQSSSEFSMRYTEKSGSVITRVHELFLTGIKDGRTEVKTYHGLLEDDIVTETGYEYETFSFLYMVTDNTMRKLEKAYYIVAAQPTTAETNIYNSEKGDIGFKEVSVTMQGFPITGNLIDQKAQAMLDWLNSPENPNRMINDSNNFAYTGIDDITTGESSFTTTTAANATTAVV
jgi:hypothetical protein